MAGLTVLKLTLKLDCHTTYLTGTAIEKAYFSFPH